jgi:hypothetical protein
MAQHNMSDLNNATVEHIAGSLNVTSRQEIERITRIVSRIGTEQARKLVLATMSVQLNGGLLSKNGQRQLQPIEIYYQIVRKLLESEQRTDDIAFVFTILKNVQPGEQTSRRPVDTSRVPAPAPPAPQTKKTANQPKAVKKTRRKLGAKGNFARFNERLDERFNQSLRDANAPISSRPTKREPFVQAPSNPIKRTGTYYEDGTFFVEVDGELVGNADNHEHRQRMIADEQSKRGKKSK